MEIDNIQLRTLVRETKLSGHDRVVIAASSEESGRAAAGKLKAALEAIDCDAEVLNNPDAEVIKEAKGPVFVIGNLANNLCAQELYYLFFSLTDRWYPGPAGYEVRTLMDPLGTGQNIILLGYSDDDGLEAGLSILLGKIADPLPFLSEVHAVKFPIPDFEVKEDLEAAWPEKDYTMARNEAASGKCYLAYLTGDEELIRESSKFWEAILRYGVPPGDHRIKDLHLRSVCLLNLFRLMEQVGMIKEELRLPILKFFYELAESDDHGIGHIDIPVYQAEGYPRQNHGLIPAMGFVLMADYFNRHHPELQEPYRWKKVADGVFAPYNDGSWKPMCDGLSHQWWLSQPVMLDYALMDPEHRYLESGGARKAADCAIAVLNNQGWMPSSGDGNLQRAFVGPILRVGAAWYKDGRYRFVHDLAPESRSLYLKAFLIRTFYTDVEPVEPKEDTGLTVVPMDPLVYYSWEKNPELTRIRTETPPHAPIEKCFDKLIFRSGWNLDDDCLLVDGLGHFSHAYADAMEIIEYARYGLSFIVSEHGAQNPEPESHSIVTITRDGEIGPIPGWAEILKAESDDEGNGYVSMRLEDFAGADWVRELHFRKGVGVVIHDTITATKPGDYAIQSHLRVPGSVTLEDNILSCKRTSPTVGEVEFSISGYSSEEATFQIRKQDLSLWHRNPQGEASPPPENDRLKAWQDRYHIDERFISIYCGRAAAKLEAGESVSFTQFARAKGPNDAEYEITPEKGSVTLTGGGQSWTLPVSGQGERAKTAAAGGVDEIKSLQTSEVARFEAEINSLAPAGESNLLCGLSDGSLVLFDKSGNIQWTAQLEGSVHDATALEVEGKPMYFAGHGDHDLSALNEKGEVVWTENIVRDPTSCAWWELNDSSAVQVKAFKAGDETLIAVGCGDLQVRVYDTDGNQKGALLYENGVPARINVVDVDGDGVPEIVVGGEIISNQSTCRILTPYAEMKYELRVEGWTSKLTSWTHEKVNGRYCVACGASRKRNLHIYELPAGGQDQAEPVHVLEKNMGGAVTGVGLFPDDEFVVSGTTMGFVVAYNFDGSVRWKKLLDHSVAGIITLKDSLLVWDNVGSCYQLSRDGACMAEAKLGEAIGDLFVDDAIYLVKGNAVVRLETE